MEFGNLTVDYPNAPARGPVPGDYAAVVVAPFRQAGVMIQLAGGHAIGANVVGISLSAEPRRRVFGLPVGPRPRLGFPNLKSLLSIRAQAAGDDLTGDVRRGLWLGDGGQLLDLVNLEVGGTVRLILAAALDGQTGLTALYADGGPVCADIGSRQSIAVQVKLLSAGLPDHLAYEVSLVDGQPAITAIGEPDPAFLAATRIVTPGYNRPS